MTIRPIRKLILPVLACTVLAGAAPTVIEVGPNRTYTTILEAVQGENLYQPFTNDVIIKVDDGVVDYESVHLIDADALGNMGSFTFHIEGVGSAPPPADGDITYYLGGEGEYRFDGSGLTIVENLDGGGLLGRRLRTATMTSPDEYYLSNHLGSTISSVDQTGTRVGPVFEYFPYGKMRMIVGASGEPITEGFTGKEFDIFADNSEEDGEGLYYFGTRYFDADIGMWITTDVAAQFFNPYAFSPNPVNGIDPDGNYVIDIESNGRVFGCVDGPYSSGDFEGYRFNGQTVLGSTLDFDATRIFDVTLYENGDIVAVSLKPWDYYNKIKTGGDWDFKNLGGTYGHIFGDGYRGSLNLSYNGESWRNDDFGNYHFGYTANKNGWPKGISLFGAGMVQLKRAVINKDYDIPWQDWKTYFDEPGDQEMIIRGYAR